MEERYRDDLKALVSTDEEGRVRQILHRGELWQPQERTPRPAAIEYVRQQADLIGISLERLDRLHERIDYWEPREEGESFQLDDEKRQFDGVTVSFAQTCLNVPVWRAGLTVTVKDEPPRIVESAIATLPKVRAKMPSGEAIEHWRTIARGAERRPPAEAEAEEPSDAELTLRDALGIEPQRPRKGERKGAATATGPRINRVRLYVYRYDPDQRQTSPHQVEPDKADEQELEPTFPLPPVPRGVRAGRDYLVAEVLFSLPFEGHPMNWIALVEVETNAILYLRARIAGVNGLVFEYDPVTSTGDLTKTASQANAVLNPLRDDLTLTDLNAPVGGTQELRGTHVRVLDASAPTVAPPTQGTGADFDYEARTNEFAAVSAYFHANDIFKLMESLGFNLATYFDGTTFPISVDHRASISTSDGLEVNAFCGGDAGSDGIGVVGFCLGDLTDTAHPLGRAVDKYVHWHEICGHGILWDHVSSPNFGFAHSAGDGLAGIRNDPESQLRELGLVERFRYAPFRPIRWMNRKVTDGWGWGGANDVGGYSSEEILATTHFRLYRSIGGDSASLATREYASRVAMYLIMRAIGELTPATNPANALAWCNRLIATDLLDWTSEGLSGGAYNKVIRWSFEKQGLFQPAGAATPVVSAGAPPQVDVYIDDGRGGEYPYQPVHWENVSIWNRNAADGMTTHQPAIEGAPNFAYVKVKNRGTSNAANVTVKGYHSLPGAGLLWPNDFTAMSPAAGLSAGTVAANSAGEVTVGPFEWVPNVNVYGHDCVLMVASVPGDPSNVDNLGPGETIAEWRLVPNDNNVGQRNVQLVPGGGGGESLISGLDTRVFFVGNTSRWRKEMDLQVELPPLLRERGWRLRLRGVEADRFFLEPRERRRVTIELSPGRDFATDAVEAADERDIRVVLSADGMPIGGMTYRIDPSLKAPPEHCRDSGCRDQAAALLRCLDIPDKGVRDVKVKNISLDIRMEDDGC